MSRIGEWLKKAENLARGHSKQADQVLDRAERYAKERTGHKYDDKISKGVDAVQRRYGGGGTPGATGTPGEHRPPYPPQQQPYSQEERERRTQG
ncbi:unnamed protein product [[Actinomadura] parvosata subsp. kistnae]|uniref:Antitoxin n=1 Tax=[Actinomadura] parvosata subsp. kistnae TaxID=1909395 RepID=A0A1V0AHG6_9ACTN|nr:antitoxin [Nonomuraea sp. ATCC 55076]AQZ69645.1 hypothetical protein BKM31_56555 [Nonomuraea sp. ATCC 55076]SPL91654.1 unnamed protein product [Actinomadura parvosata subsp. kistnae]